MRRLVATLFALTTLAAPLAAPLAAQAHPDFSGKWVLDPKSVENGMGPTAMTLTVKQDDKNLTIETAATSQMGDMKSTTVLNLDGSESKNKVTGPGGSVDLTSTGKWDGPAYVVTTKGDVQGNAMTQTDRWSLGADGKTLQLQRDASVMGQTFSLKFLFNKQ